MDIQFKLKYAGIEYNVTVNGLTCDTTIDPPDYPSEVFNMASIKSMQISMARMISAFN